MKLYFFLVLAMVVLAVSGCSSPTGTPVEFANACSIENEKKYIEVGGFLDARGSVFCSNIGGGRMECGLDLKEAPAGDKKLRVEIEQGSSANSIEELPRGYKTEDIKIRDNGGNIINLADKVRLTGEMSIAPDGSVCFMKVTKIER